jgi:hypothetical protein
MAESLLLIEGTDVNEESLRSQSLRNAKPLVYGRFGGGHVVHLGLNSLDDLAAAIVDLAAVPGVSGITTLAVRN